MIRIRPIPRARCTRTQEVEDLRLGRDVERRRRLVGDQQLRVARERSGERDPLAHPARQLERVAVRDQSGRRCRLRPAAAASRPGSRGSRPIARRPAGEHLRRCARPQRSSGFSIVNGSWNISEITPTPELPHLASREASIRSRPRYRTLPSANTPSGSSRAIARAVSDLPEPDSPTIATVSPAPDERGPVPTVIVSTPAFPIPTRSGARRPPGAATSLGHRVDIRSYIQSPMMLMLAAVTTIAAAGSRAAIGFVKQDRAVLEQHPAPVGVPGGTPSPRKERPARLTRANAKSSTT